MALLAARRDLTLSPERVLPNMLVAGPPWEVLQAKTAFDRTALKNGETSWQVNSLQLNSWMIS